MESDPDPTPTGPGGGWSSGSGTTSLPSTRSSRPPRRRSSGPPSRSRKPLVEWGGPPRARTTALVGPEPPIGALPQLGSDSWRPSSGSWPPTTAPSCAIPRPPSSRSAWAIPTGQPTPAPTPSTRGSYANRPCKSCASGMGRPQPTCSKAMTRWPAGAAPVTLKLGADEAGPSLCQRGGRVSSCRWAGVARTGPACNQMRDAAGGWVAGPRRLVPLAPPRGGAPLPLRAGEPRPLHFSVPLCRLWRLPDHPGQAGQLPGRGRPVLLADPPGGGRQRGRAIPGQAVDGRGGQRLGR
jgi:hypothetical protein